MKKILSFVLVCVMLCCGLVFTANMADAVAEEGAVFGSPNIMYAIEEKLEKEPLTVEAVIYFNKRSVGNKAGGTIFGNYHWDESTENFDVGIIEKGVPRLRIRNNANVYVYTFKDVNVYTNEWVHITFVRDIEKKEARCYINGELAQTLPMTETIAPIATWGYKIGSNEVYMNPEYYRGAIKSLAVYSDVRTDAEIKKDVEKLDKSDLLVAYDFSGIGENHPETVKDLGNADVPAVRNRMFFDSEFTSTDKYAYTFAVLGDTQSMAVNYPDHFADMYNFIYDNIESMNIEAVLGLGDITDTRDGANTENEWKIALAGHKIIDDVVLNIPITGDHDNAYWYNKTVEQLNYGKFVKRYAENDLRNGYVTADIGGVPYLFIQFQKGPNDDILKWADGVVAAHPDHNVIIATHGYLYHDGTTLDVGDMHLAQMSNYGEAMWEKFVSKHENIVLVLSGHIGHDYVVVNQRKGVNGNTVTEMLMDFQSVDNAAVNYGLSKNGCGVVNLFHFSADGKTLTVETYATVLEKHFMELNQLTIEIDPANDKTYVKPEKAPLPPRSNKVEIKMTLDSLTATVNGEAKTLDAAPVIKNSRTMLPVRFVAENLGATVGWDAATQTVSINGTGVVIQIKIGYAFATVNGRNIALDSPAYIDPSNNRTYLPVRVVAENLGATVSWDDATKTATLTKE